MSILRQRNKYHLYRKNIRRLVILFLFIAVAVVLVYVYKFGLNLSNNTTVWAEFGDYFGGIISPVASGLAFIGLILTVFLQIDQINLYREETKRLRKTKVVDLVMEYEKKWESSEVRDQRRTAASFLMANIVNGRPSEPSKRNNWSAWSDVDDIVDFFQGMGAIVKHAEFDEHDVTLIYGFFYCWLSNYWYGCKEYIDHVASIDNTWEHAIYIYNAFDKVEKRLNKHPLVIGEDSWWDFILSEQPASLHAVTSARATNGAGPMRNQPEKPG